MVKILIGLLAAAAIAVGGYFGFEAYVQHRVAGDVETGFAHIRASGGKASHGAVSFDRRSRTIRIADIVVESAAQPPISVKIDSVTASGVDQPAAGRFAADTIEATGLEINAAFGAQSGLRLGYKVPQLVVKGYLGPAGAPAQPASQGAVELYRSVIRQLAEVAASSITAPNLSLTFSDGAATQGSYNYSDLALRDIKNGTIASTTAERVTIAASVPQPGAPGQFSGEAVKLAASDFDINAVAMLLDPEKANDDRIHRVYRQLTFGTYAVTIQKGPTTRIDGFTIDDVGVRPSRMQLLPLLAMLPAAGAEPPTPAQARELIEKIAGIYEGIRIGKAEMKGLAVETPQGSAKLATLRFNLENGKVGEFAFEGFDARSPNGPVKVDRFVLKSVDIAGLLRMAAQFSNPAQKPSPDQFFGLIPLIAGAEVKGLVAPYKNTGKPVNIDLVSLDWGQFVGSIPSKARLTVKMSGPFDPADPGQQMLIAAGLDKAAIDLDLGAGWTEAARSFALEPVKLDIDGLFKASAKLSLANVPREMFSTDPLQAATRAAQIEAGMLELTVRDTGGVDLVVAQFARQHNVSRAEARQAIVDSIKSGSAGAAGNSGAMAISDALVSFVENPRTTLTLKLTARGKVPAQQLLQLLKTDPLTALSRFEIEAATAL